MEQNIKSDKLNIDIKQQNIFDEINLDLNRLKEDIVINRTDINIEQLENNINNMIDNIIKQIDIKDLFKNILNICTTEEDTINTSQYIIVNNTSNISTRTRINNTRKKESTIYNCMYCNKEYTRLKCKQTHESECKKNMKVNVIK